MTSIIRFYSKYKYDPELDQMMPIGNDSESVPFT
jgi:hypothetical protein